MLVRLSCIVFLVFACVGCSGSLDEPRRLSANEVSQVSGRLKLNPDATIGSVVYSITPTMDVYNGTEWSLTDIDVMVDSGSATRVFRFTSRRLEAKKDAKGDIERQIAPSFVGPLSNGALEAETGDFFVGLKEVKSFRIVSARGFKK
jgi:hypothetical protein